MKLDEKIWKKLIKEITPPSSKLKIDCLNKCNEFSDIKGLKNYVITGKDVTFYIDHDDINEVNVSRSFYDNDKNSFNEDLGLVPTKEEWSSDHLLMDYYSKPVKYSFLHSDYTKAIKEVISLDRFLPGCIIYCKDQNTEKITLPSRVSNEDDSEVWKCSINLSSVGEYTLNLCSSMNFK